MIISNNNVVHATELHKVFKFGILRYLVSHPNEYGNLIHGVINPIKNNIFIPTGKMDGLNGPDGLMYNINSGIIESSVQMKHFSGTSIMNEKGFNNLLKS
jgi:hypothetical protein